MLLNWLKLALSLFSFGQHDLFVTSVSIAMMYFYVVVTKTKKINKKQKYLLKN